MTVCSHQVVLYIQPHRVHALNACRQSVHAHHENSRRRNEATESHTKTCHCWISLVGCSAGLSDEVIWYLFGRLIFRPRVITTLLLSRCYFLWYIALAFRQFFFYRFSSVTLLSLTFSLLLTFIYRMQKSVQFLGDTLRASKTRKSKPKHQLRYESCATLQIFWISNLYGMRLFRSYGLRKTYLTSVKGNLRPCVITPHLNSLYKATQLRS